MTLREGARPCTTTRARRKLVPTGEPDAVLRVRRRAGRGRPGERLPLDRARHRHRVRQVGHAGARQGHASSRRCRTCSSAATRRSARRTSSGRWRTATTPRSRSTSCCTARTCASGPRPTCTLMSQKMGIHEWSYDNDDLRRRCATRCRGPTAKKTLKSIKVEVELGFDVADRVEGSAALPQLRRADGVRRQAVHRVRRLRRHLPDGLHHLHRQRRGGGPAHAPDRAGAEPDAGPLRLRRR